MSELEALLLPNLQTASDSLVELFNRAMTEHSSGYLDHLAGEVSKGKKTLRAIIDFDMNSVATVRFYEVNTKSNKTRMILDAHGKQGRSN